MNRNADYDIRGPDIPLEMFGAPRVRFSLGVPQGPEASDRRRLVHRHLRRRQEWEVLLAIADGTVSVHQVVRMLEKHGESGVADVRAMVDRERLGAVPSFAEEVGRYVTSYANGRRSPESLKNTRSRLKRVAEQDVMDHNGTEVCFGALALDRITRGQIVLAVRQISSNPSTQGNLYAAISGLFTWSVEEEGEAARVSKRRPRWSVNPTSKVETPKRTKRAVTASSEQVLALIAAGQLYQQAYVRAFAQVGLRLGELIHTRLHHDLDPQTWVWRIQARGPDSRCRCIQCRDEGWSPKSERGTRTFRVPTQQTELIATLDAWIDATAPEPGDFVFARPDRGGAPWTNRTLASDFKKLCDRAGVRYGAKADQGVTIHTLRHTCITALVRAGERESVIADLTGDKVSTIVETYVHLNEDDLANAIGRSPSYA